MTIPLDAHPTRDQWCWVCPTCGKCGPWFESMAVAIRNAQLHLHFKETE